MSEWYDLGVFLGAPTQELKRIQQNYQLNGVMRCLMELYDFLTNTGKSFSWETIATALRRTGNNKLADRIHSDYILPFIRQISSADEFVDSLPPLHPTTAVSPCPLVLLLWMSL